jgi:hypothetical protein
VYLLPLPRSRNELALAEKIETYLLTRIASSPSSASAPAAVRVPAAASPPNSAGAPTSAATPAVNDELLPVLTSRRPARPLAVGNGVEAICTTQSAFDWTTAFIDR